MLNIVQSSSTSPISDLDEVAEDSAKDTTPEISCMDVLVAEMIDFQPAQLSFFVPGTIPTSKGIECLLFPRINCSCHLSRSFCVACKFHQAYLGMSHPGILL